MDRFDCKLFGQMVKNARIKKGWTREVLAEKVNLVPRYIMAIENQGQTPSLQVFYALVNIFNISVDRLFFDSKTHHHYSVKRRAVNTLLDQLSDTELTVIEATIRGMLEMKNINEDMYL